MVQGKKQGPLTLRVTEHNNISIFLVRGYYYHTRIISATEALKNGIKIKKVQKLKKKKFRNVFVRKIFSFAIIGTQIKEP